VHAGTKVMDDVISIVPANLVVACVNAVDGVRVKIVGVLPVYERMLCPVSKHHHQTGEDQRNDEDNERCLQVHKAHSNAEGDVNVFSDCESRVQFLALAIVQVEDRILYSYKHELEKVSYEMKSAVTLITHCAAGIIFKIVFYMVHSHVVTEISFGSVAEQGTDNPRDVAMYPLNGFAKAFTMAEAMKQQSKPPFEIEL